MVLERRSDNVKKQTEVKILEIASQKYFIWRNKIEKRTRNLSTFLKLIILKLKDKYEK